MADSKKTAEASQVEVQEAAPGSISDTQNADFETIEVNYDNWKATKATAVNSTSKALYNVEFHYMRKPAEILINSASDGTLLGKATLHMMKPRAEFAIGGSNSTVSLGGSVSGRFKASTPTSDGERLVWNAKPGIGAKNFILTCHVDNTLVARFTTTFGWKPVHWKNFGKMEFVADGFESQLKRDELFIFGLTLTWAVQMGWFSAGGAVATMAGTASGAGIGAAAGAAGGGAGGGGGGGG